MYSGDQGYAIRDIFKGKTGRVVTTSRDFLLGIPSLQPRLVAELDGLVWDKHWTGRATRRVEYHGSPESIFVSAEGISTEGRTKQVAHIIKALLADYHRVAVRYNRTVAGPAISRRSRELASLFE